MAPVNQATFSDQACLSVPVTPSPTRQLPLDLADPGIELDDIVESHGERHPACAPTSLVRSRLLVKSDRAVVSVHMLDLMNLDFCHKVSPSSSQRQPQREDELTQSCGTSDRGYTTSLPISFQHPACPWPTESPWRNDQSRHGDYLISTLRN